MRILHIGDVHIDQAGDLEMTEKALAFAADLARRERVDLVAIPGDIYGLDTNHKGLPKEEAVFVRFVEQLEGIPLFLSRGNHDAPGTLQVFRLSPNVRVFEEPAVVSLPEADVIILPWPEKGFLAAKGLSGEGGLQAAQLALGDLVKGLALSRPAPEKPILFMGHISIVGALSSSCQPLVGREVQMLACDLQEALSHQFSDGSWRPWYAALNHIHKPQDPDVGIVYAGSLTCQNWGEEDEQKSVVLVDLPARGVATMERIPVPERKWVTIDAHVEGGVAPLEKISGGLPLILPLPDACTGANVRFRYTCDEAEAHFFDHLEIKRRFAGAHSLKIEHNITRAERTRGAEVAAAKGPVEKLEAYAQATGAEITDRLRFKAIEITEGGN